MSELLLAAFRSLGPAATWRETQKAGRALRERGDGETLALFRPLDGSYFDHASCDGIIERAEEAGAGRVTGLNLYTAVIRPGWSPMGWMDDKGPKDA